MPIHYNLSYIYYVHCVRKVILIVQQWQQAHHSIYRWPKAVASHSLGLEVFTWTVVLLSFDWFWYNVSPVCDQETTREVVVKVQAIWVSNWSNTNPPYDHTSSGKNTFSPSLYSIFQNRKFMPETHAHFVLSAILNQYICHARFVCELDKLAYLLWMSKAN